MKNELEEALKTIEELKLQLYEANCIIEAIQDGAIDALVVNKEGQTSIYSLESADYTYRMLIEKSGEGALSISSSGLVVYSNERFAQMVGLEVSKIIGTYFNSYIDSVGTFQQLKQELLVGPSKGEIVLNVDGRRIPVYASLTDLRPQVDAIGLIITDLSEKRLQEDALAAYRQKLEARIAELKRNNSNLEQYIYVLTHDIKEPLRKIIEYSNPASKPRGTKSGKEESRRLSVINNSARRVSSMVSDVSRYALNIHHPDTAEVDLNAVIKEVTDDLSLVMEERNVQLTLNDLPLIKGSRLQMHLLFLNLLDNAIRFRTQEEKAHIRISAEIDDCVDLRRPNKKYYRIQLYDHVLVPSGVAGTSISDMQRNGNGELPENGLGISICKKIMENHAGKFELQKSHTGEHVFLLYFPLQ